MQNLPLYIRSLVCEARHTSELDIGSPHIPAHLYTYSRAPSWDCWDLRHSGDSASSKPYYVGQKSIVSSTPFTGVGTGQANEPFSLVVLGLSIGMCAGDAPVTIWSSRAAPPVCLEPLLLATPMKSSNFCITRGFVHHREESSSDDVTP